MYKLKYRRQSRNYLARFPFPNIYESCKTWAAGTRLDPTRPCWSAKCKTIDHSEMGKKRCRISEENQAKISIDFWNRGGSFFMSAMFWETTESIHLLLNRVGYENIVDWVDKLTGWLSLLVKSVAFCQRRSTFILSPFTFVLSLPIFSTSIFKASLPPWLIRYSFLMDLIL